MTYRQLARDTQAPLDMVLDAAATVLKKRVTDPDSKLRGPDEPRIRAEVKRRLTEITPPPAPASAARVAPNPGPRPASHASPAHKRGTPIDDIAIAFGVSDGALPTVIEDVDLTQVFGGVRPLRNADPAPTSARTPQATTASARQPPPPAPPVANERGSVYATELQKHADRLALERAALQRAHDDLLADVETERTANLRLRKELDDVREKWARLDKALAQTFPLAIENARLHDQLRDAHERVAALEARPAAMSLEALFAQRGVIGEDEIWMALTALRQGGRHGELMRLIVLAHPELTMEFLEERLILLADEERPPKGLVAVRVPPHRSESPPSIIRAIRRLYNGVIARGPRADGSRRDLLVIGGRPYQHRQILDVEDPLVGVRAVPATTRFEPRDTPELVVLWRCGDHLAELRERFPDACVVEDPALAVMLEAAWQHLHGV